MYTIERINDWSPIVTLIGRGELADPCFANLPTWLIRAIGQGELGLMGDYHVRAAMSEESDPLTVPVHAALDEFPVPVIS
jgi:hypothetical protein